jgi:MoxR-like ATPase
MAFNEPSDKSTPSGAATPAAAANPGDDLAIVETLRKGRDALQAEMGKLIVGQKEVIDQILIALFCRGHGLMVGVPGLAKTLMVRTLSQILDLSFNRVQFTPDLMPSDIVGTDVIEEDQQTRMRSFRFIKGPVFANLILADEINRTPPKTQAALLEAMEEHRVTAGGQTYVLPEPFFVLATQNPIEQEGTYPLPEAQLDRFMFMINVGYPTEEEEMQILEMTTAGYESKIEPVLDAPEILDLQRLVRKVTAGDEIMRNIVRIVRKTRTTETSASAAVKKWVSWGAGPRACQNLVLGAKAHAILDGRREINMNDVIEVSKPVLGHRILVNFMAQSEGVTSSTIVDELLKEVV